MTLYEEIMSYDADTLAAFIYGLIAETEEDVVAKLSMMGINISMCSLSEDVRIAMIKHDLMEEVTDDTKHFRR